MGPIIAGLGLGILGVCAYFWSRPPAGDQLPVSEEWLRHHKYQATKSIPELWDE